MRNYSQVSPRFWTGPTGRALRRAGAEAQLVALYLLTAPGANMIGLYRLALAVGAAETGLSAEAFSRGVTACIQAGFCEYDADNEVVWVIRMAHHQLGVLKPGDKRITNCERLAYDVDYSPLAEDFYQAYGDFTNPPKFPDLEAP